MEKAYTWEVITNADALAQAHGSYGRVPIPLLRKEGVSFWQHADAELSDLLLRIGLDGRQWTMALDPHSAMEDAAQLKPTNYLSGGIQVKAFNPAVIPGLNYSGITLNVTRVVDLTSEETLYRDTPNRPSARARETWRPNHVSTAPACVGGQ